MDSLLLITTYTAYCQPLRDTLHASGVECVLSVPAGAFHAVEARRFDAVLLDLDLSMAESSAWLSEWLQKNRLPSWILSDRQDQPVVDALKRGVDGWLPRSVDSQLLLASITALGRRLSQPIAQEPDVIELDDLVLQRFSRSVQLQGCTVELTGAEFSVLELLLKEAGRIVSREKLSEHALNRSRSKYDRSIDVHLSQLRKKLGLYRDGSERIKTVRGIGVQYIRQQG